MVGPTKLGRLSWAVAGCNAETSRLGTFSFRAFRHCGTSATLPRSQRGLKTGSPKWVVVFPVSPHRPSPYESTQAPLAQLDRASVYGTEGYWFEPSGVYFESLEQRLLRAFFMAVSWIQLGVRCVRYRISYRAGYLGLPELSPSHSAPPHRTDSPNRIEPGSRSE